MATKNNIRSIRFSDELAELIERQQGENFTQKFENLVYRCAWELPAKERELKQLEERRHNIAKREEARVADANAIASKLNDATVKIVAQVGEEGQLFGSVGTVQIAEAIQEQLGVEVDRRRIELGKPIKAVGEYTVPVGFYRDIKANVKVVVAGDTVEDAEAVVEAAGEALADAVEAAVEAEAAEAVAEDVVEEAVEEAADAE